MSEGYQGGGEHQHHHQQQLVVGGSGGGGSQLLPFYLHVPQHSRREKLRYPPCTDVNDHGDPSPPAPQPSYNAHAYVVPPPLPHQLFISGGGGGVTPPSLLPPPSYLEDHNSNPSYSTAADVAAPATTNPPQFTAGIHNHFHQYPYYPFFPHQPVSLSLSSSHSSAFHHPAVTATPTQAPLASRCPPSATSAPAQPFTGYAAVLKGSRFLRPAQQMLQEICEVGALGRAVVLQSCSDSGAGGLGEPEPLSPDMAVDAGPSDGGVDGHMGGGERRRIKTRLVSMLDEVCRRYRQYYQQILAVVTSFESVAGLGNAAPYTSLALSSMTKHFRYLKNAISEQLRFTEKAFGKESCKGDFSGFGNASGGGIFFHGAAAAAPHSSANIGQPSVWRPQRGLPERAVAVLKAWLFEHFLHPYPTDTDKHMLAKQTGLTRNQVSNWFINARVRLWKPLVEEIHSLEVRQAQKGSKPDNSPANNDQQPHVATTSTDQSSADHPSSNRTNENASHRGKNQDPPPPPKRFRNEHLAELPNNSSVDEPGIQYSFSDFPGGGQQHHLGATTNIPCASNGGVSLTLGLHQNDGMCLPEPLPYNMARRFGLEEGSGGYGMGGFEVNDHHRHFGKGIDGHLLHDFVG